MTEVRTQITCLDEKRVDGKKIYNYRQRLQQYKRKCDKDIGPLIKEETINATDREVKEKKIQQDFFGHWDPKQHTT